MGSAPSSGVVDGVGVSAWNPTMSDSAVSSSSITKSGSGLPPTSPMSSTIVPVPPSEMVLLTELSCSGLLESSTSNAPAIGFSF